MPTCPPWGSCVICGCGLYVKPMVYHGTGPLCWGCWSKCKRGVIHVDGKPTPPSRWRRFLNWLGSD